MGQKMPDADWMGRAACRGMDTRIFFPERGDWRALERAKAVCAGCPVTEECFAYAVTGMMGGGAFVRDGVWGGRSGRQLRGSKAARAAETRARARERKVAEKLRRPVDWEAVEQVERTDRAG